MEALLRAAAEPGWRTRIWTSTPAMLLPSPTFEALALYHDVLSEPYISRAFVAPVRMHDAQFHNST